MIKRLLLVLCTFVPSVHGFKFSNRFPEKPVINVSIPFLGKVKIGSASNGMCGGMVFAALDHFNAGKKIPDTTDVPEGELYDLIARRMVDSIRPLSALKVYCWMSSEDLSECTLQEFEKLKEMESPTPLMLILKHSYNPFVGKDNHQVLAYSANDNEIKIYDPNNPCDDDVTIRYEDGKFIHSHVGEVRGFYITKYTPRTLD